MKRQTANILTGILSVGLLTTLIIRLTTVPGGMILSGPALGTMWILLILLTCLILTIILRRFLKTYSFLTIFFFMTALGFSYFHYKLYSPTLTIIVPANYSGEVDLVLADIEENILTVDTNGIGYINQWTFDKTYTRPIVKDENGNNLDSLLFGFNPTSFWGKGKSCCIDKNEIYSKRFKIERKKIETTFKHRSLIDLADRQLIKLMKPDKYTSITTETKTENIDTKTDE
jgi:hypothetical protein